MTAASLDHGRSSKRGLDGGNWTAFLRMIAVLDTNAVIRLAIGNACGSIPIYQGVFRSTRRIFP